MAILANSARGMPPRMHRAYRLEMSGRTLLTLLLLLSLTGLVVFYLGVVTGKGLRDPNPPLTASATAPGALPGAPAAGTNPTNLTFNQSLSSPNPQIEGLKTEQAKLSDNTNKLVAQAKQELELEEVSAKSTQTGEGAKPTVAASKPAPAATASKPVVAAAAPKPAASVAAAPVAPKPAAPAAKPAAKPAAAPAMSGEGGYTVQVFSSTKQANAQDLVNTLKRKGFPAYLNQFQAEDKQTWYRVRVGKGTKTEADAMAAKLIKDGDIKSPRVLQQ